MSILINKLEALNHLVARFDPDLVEATMMYTSIRYLGGEIIAAIEGHPPTGETREDVTDQWPDAADVVREVLKHAEHILFSGLEKVDGPRYMGKAQIKLGALILNIQSGKKVINLHPDIE